MAIRDWSAALIDATVALQNSKAAALDRDYAKAILHASEAMRFSTELYEWHREAHLADK